jgi:alpha,alpha-trehalase
MFLSFSKSGITAILLLTLFACNTPSSSTYLPDEVFGDLFKEVQTTKVLGDYKTFVDAIPQSAPEEILAAYHQSKDKEDFDLKAFVLEHFELPTPLPAIEVDTKQDLKTHLQAHWKNLVRQPIKTDPNSTLIELPHPYVVPGGRFREMFYWDSYFSILGLLESKEEELALGMIRNFAFLIDQYGYIPNGNRTYFLSRSQPPFFAATLIAYGEKFGMESIVEFLPQLEKEYTFWMDGHTSIPDGPYTGQHLIVLNNGAFFNRYYGAKDYARAEGYGKEMRWAESIPKEEQPQFFRNLRTVCESGWDFSTRWYADGLNKSTIHAMDLAPVDLNSLLFMAEELLAQLHQQSENEKQAQFYNNRAAKRKAILHHYFFDRSQQIYLDYDFVGDSLTARPTLAMLYPLYAQCATRDAAQGVADFVSEHFLSPGGLVTSLVPSGEQWDYPNGWAPHQFIGVRGLLNYEQEELAQTIAQRWLSLNKKIYHEEGKMMEKYNVVDTTLQGGGGEYPNQDGFGWTNGVALVLMGVEF